MNSGAKMLRLALRSRAVQRRLTSSQSAIPHAAPEHPVHQPQSSLSTAIANLYEDEITNSILAPNFPNSPVNHQPQPPASHMRDAYLYGPADQAAYERQLALEEQTVNQAVDRYRKMSTDATSRGDVVTHRAAADLLHAWFNPLTLATRAAQGVDDAADGSKPTPVGEMGRSVFGRKPVDEEIAHLLAQLPSDAIAVITIHAVLGALMREANGIPLTRLALSVASIIKAEINLKKINALQRRQEKIEQKQKSEGGLDSEPKKRGRRAPKKVLSNAVKSSGTLVSAVNFAAQQVAVKGTSWSQREMLLLGTRLIDLLMSVALVEDDGNFVPALSHFKKFRQAEMVNVGMLQLTDPAMKLLAEETDKLYEVILPKQQPMLVRPRPWTSPTDGAFLRCQAHLVRTTAVSQKDLDNALAAADLSVLYEGLNALGDQEWRVNRRVLETAQEIWDQGGGTAGLVTKKDCPVPNRKEFLAAQRAAFERKKAEDGKCRSIEGTEDGEEDKEMVFDEKGASRRLRHERRKAQKLNRELVSMRADTNNRMEQGRKFLNEERLWLPHNVDFRGRAYPIPVHLQHMGCDLTRAMLTFANPGIELGARGVYWLKIHLANLLGADKLSFAERIARAEDAMCKAIEVGRDPTSDSNLEWWSTAEDPFQLLAACAELAAAVGRHGGEAAMERFESTLPISMDGSCNGLQHYAALGRDVAGGEQVNLVPNTRPQDVYSGIADLVREQIDKLAGEGDEVAMALQGKITRKVVKQTVMTSVYGVTLIGAREQIHNRLAEVEGLGDDKLFPGSMKLASLTLSSLGDIFSGASRTMDWLYNAAAQISREGHEVQWMTPVGLPVIQPYRRSERMIVRTLMQRVTLERNQEHTPVSTTRQRSAFAPNFVHSIDSAHMLLTAIACSKQGLNFAAVHDSFWTNAACVDTMNRILREEFIKLHERDLLAELREGFLMRYEGVKFAEVPPRGKLDLNVVRDSHYFFS